MKKGTKIAGLVLAAVLLVTASVFGTLAYLTDSTDQLKNTFTVGKVDIKLDEAKVNEKGEYLEKSGSDYVVTTDPTKAYRLTGASGETGNSYNLIPGKTYPKDPTVTVIKGSEDCYVFVKVVNNLKYTVTDNSSPTNKTLEASEDTASTPNYYQIEKQIIGNSPTGNVWTKLANVDNVYYKEYTKDENNDTTMQVFKEFKIDPNITNEQFKEYADNCLENNRIITIKAAAVQKEGFADATAAWVQVSSLFQ